MATKLTKEQIAAILAGQLPGWGFTGGDTGNYIGSPESGGTWQASPQQFYQDLGGGMRTAYDAEGNPVEENYKVGESVFNPGEIAAFLAAAYGLNALGGAMGAGGAAAAAPSAAGMGAEYGGAAGEILGANTAGYTPGMGLMGSGGALGTTGLNAMRQGELASYATNGALPAAAVAGGSSGLLPSLSGLGLLGDVAKIGAPLLGAVAGAKGSPEQVSQSKTDPRLDPYLYGDQGILKSAADWYATHKTGSNPIMQQGWDMQKGLITNPQVQQQLAGLLSNAYGLFQSPVAGNPWKKG